MIKGVQLLVFTIIVLTVFINSFITAYGSYHSFYEKEEAAWYQSFESFILDSRFFELFSIYTGMNTGYGFFSPNVSSDFIITHELFENGKKEIALSDRAFQSKEGRIRFTGINNLYMDKLDALEAPKDSVVVDSLRLKFLDVILKRMNAVHLKKGKIDSIKTTLYLYHFPLLKEYPDVTPQLIAIENHTNYATEIKEKNK